MTARRSARCRGCGRTSSRTSARSPRRSRRRCGSGWLIAPPAWRERLLEARESLDHGLPALEQLALADFITRGAYDRHLRRSGRAYRRRRDALIEALRAALPGATFSGAAAGPAHRRPHPGRRRARAGARLPRAGVSSTASPRTASRPARPAC